MNTKGIKNNLILAFFICVIAEAIGPVSLTFGKFTIKILAIIWAITLGTIISPFLIGKFIPFFKKLITQNEINKAGYMLSIALYPLGVLFGIYAGPRVGIIFETGPAILLQEFGNTFTMVIALPLGILLGLKRSSFGATFSLCRDTALGIIGDKYGLDSEEGMGTLGVYIFGSVFGTLIFTILAPLGLALGFHPYALAMASGMGSGSMMGAATASLVEASPAFMAKDIMAYSATSGLLTAVFGVYVEMFISLPVANWYYYKIYNKLEFLRSGKKEEIENV